MIAIEPARAMRQSSRAEFGGPIAVHYDKEPGPWVRVMRFLGHYDLRVYVSDVAYLDIGAGSVHMLQRLSHLSPEPGLSGCIGTIGRWCEADPTATIMAGGEHDHAAPINQSLSTLRTFVPSAGNIGLLPMKPIKIGSGVVLSAGCRVLNGVEIGDGAVVAAGTVVTRDVAAFSIVGGVPARPIGQRQHDVPWWDFSVDYLLSNLGRIQQVAAEPGPHEYRDNDPRFVLRWAGENGTLLGFSCGDEIIPLTEAPSAVRDYVVQAFQPGQNYWLSNCWADATTPWRGE